MITRLRASIDSVFIGRRAISDDVLLSLVSGLHLILEDVPGVGKTTLAKALARATGLDFGRIQFTPDLLPGDILGMSVWSAEAREFVFKPGAIMHQIVIADEINRASPRTQSALLESMQERTLTVDGVTHLLPDPFFVIATQNPESFSGTFPLPEAQIDRFGVSVSLGFPSPDDEAKILERFRHSPHIENEPVTTAEGIREIQRAVKEIHLSEAVQRFIVDIIQRSRLQRELRMGLSPRASLHLLYASQGRAYLCGRDYVTPEDVISCASIVLPHRMVLTPEAKFGGKTAALVVAELLSSLKVPAGI